MTRVGQTRPGHGSGCPWVWVRVTVRAPVTRAQPISKATANAGQRRPTQVNAGPQHPMKANAGPRRQKRDRYAFFCNWKNRGKRSPRKNTKSKYLRGQVLEFFVLGIKTRAGTTSDSETMEER